MNVSVLRIILIFIYQKKFLTVYFIKYFQINFISLIDKHNTILM